MQIWVNEIYKSLDFPFNLQFTHCLNFFWNQVCRLLSVNMSNLSLCSSGGQLRSHFENYYMIQPVKSHLHFCGFVSWDWLTYGSRYSICAINTPATHESNAASKILNSLFLILDSLTHQRRSLASGFLLTIMCEYVKISAWVI